MNQEILDFIKQNRIAVLAVEMPDGAPHAATLHYAADKDGSTFYFMTNRNYRKAEPLLAGKAAKASIVVGFDETEMKTIQADGEVRLLGPEEKEQFNQTYLGKFPEKAQFAEKPDSIFLSFVPAWWRYTDWGTPGAGKVILSTD